VGGAMVDHAGCGVTAAFLREVFFRRSPSSNA